MLPEVSDQYQVDLDHSCPCEKDTAYRTRVEKQVLPDLWFCVVYLF